MVLIRAGSILFPASNHILIFKGLNWWQVFKGHMLPVKDATIQALSKLESKVLGPMPNITATTSYHQ